MQTSDPLQTLTELYENMLVSIEPDNLFRRSFSLVESKLFYRDRPVNIETEGNLVLAGAGKAAVKMGHAIIPFLPKFPDDTLFISPEKDPADFLNVMLADHPYPSTRSYDAGYEILRLVESLHEKDTLIFLISGGASSLMAFPQLGYNIRELSTLNHIMLESGMPINEINEIRQRISKIKGGKLAKICRAKVLVFYISDVITDNISIIGSGPFAKPLAGDIESILNKYELNKKIPKKMYQNILADVPVSNMPVIPHYMIGNNRTALNSIAKNCKKKQISYRIYPDFLQGDAMKCGEKIAKMALAEKGNGPLMLIFGGETTVTLQKGSGKGGRSQETALSALNTIKDDHSIHILCAGTDGIDGPTDAVGAVVNAQTYNKARELGLSIFPYLESHDSYNFHRICKSLIKTGYTGSNVCDIALAYISV